MNKTIDLPENAFCRYEGIFLEALARAEVTINSLLPEGNKVYVVPFDFEYIATWESQWPSLGDGINDSVFDFKKLLLRRKKRAKWFVFSVWDDDKIFCIFAGKVSPRSNLVSINFLEANKAYEGKLKSKASFAASLIINEVAISVGAKNIALIKPVNDKVEKHYCSLGYKKGFLYGIKKAVFKKTEVIT